MDVVTLALARESAENAGAYLIDLTQSPIQQKILELFGVGGGSQVGVEGVTNKFWDDIPVERPLMVTLLFNGDLYHHKLQHARPPCPSPTPGGHPKTCPSSQ